MSLFEFILVMVSLLLAISVTHLLQGVATIMHRREELEVDWVPLGWATYLFVLAAAHWWSLWDMREAAWTFPSFFFVLLPPTMLFLAVSLLVSGALRPTDASMWSGFLRVRVPFFSVLLVWSVFVALDGTILGTEAMWNGLRAAQIVGALLLLIGLTSPRRRTQANVVALSTGLILFAAFVLRFLPGAFGPS